MAEKWRASGVLRIAFWLYLAGLAPEDSRVVRAAPGASEPPPPAEAPQGVPEAAVGVGSSSAPPPPVPSSRLKFVPILFAEGQARLLVDSEAILEYIAQALLADPPRSDIRVEGHSDGVETAPEGASREGRLSLSRQRAEAVRDFLVRSGVPGEQLIVVGVGSSSPLGEVRSEQDRQRNRAVVLSLVPRGSGGALKLSAAPMPDVPGSEGNPAGGRPQEAGSSGFSTGGEVHGGAGILAGAGSVSPASGGGSTPESAAAGSGNATPSSSPVEVIAVRERQQLRGPAVVETVQLGVRMIKREGPGSGGKERWPFQEFLQREIPSLEAVIRQGLSREAGLVGDMRIRLTLQADGRVSDLSLTLPLESEEYEAELRQYLLGWQLPPPPGRDIMRIELAIGVQATFQPWLEPGRQGATPHPVP